MGLLIDQLAYSNKLLHLHPGEKMALAFLTMLNVLVFPHPLISLGVCCFMAFVTVGKAGINHKVYRNLMLMPLTFLLPGIAAVVLVVRFSPSFYLGFTPDSLEQGIILLGKALAAVSCLYFLILTTPLNHQLAMLGKLKVPGLLIELMGLIYRFIMVLLASTMTILLSQKARLGYSNVKRSFYSLAALLSAVFTQGFFKMQKMNLALEARCYRGEMFYADSEFTWSPKIIAGILALELALALLGLYLGG